MLKIAIKGQPSGSLRMAREEVVEAVVVVVVVAAAVAGLALGPGLFLLIAEWDVDSHFL